jgi:two-component system OmpR family response regulator/two-component system response regulator QseB
MRILLVEDDALLGDGLRNGLRQQGFRVDWVRDGHAALRELSSGEYSACVLDLGLPMIDGMQVLEKARGSGVKSPVLVLTARDAVTERIRGLDVGADDYVVKPIDLNELGARLRALIRRANGQASTAMNHGSLMLDPSTRKVTLAGEAITLTGREFDVLHALMLAGGRVLTRDQLERHLYAWGQEVESNTVEVHIHHLRRKLGSTVIHTVRGVGYTLGDEPG